MAIFYLPRQRSQGQEKELYALDHFDPFSNANVIARGIIGDVKGSPVVASPLYKQHFRLEDGQCLEDEDVKLRTWKVAFRGEEGMGGGVTDSGFTMASLPARNSARVGIQAQEMFICPLQRIECL